METKELNKKIKSFVESLTSDIKYRVEELEGIYRENFDRLSGHLEEIAYQLRDWKSNADSLLDYGKENGFNIATIQAEAKLEVIKSMDETLTQELGRFGYKSVFELTEIE